jgi:hypothetical protein
MTVPEALAALETAPMDGAPSALNPGHTRRWFTEKVKSIVDAHGVAISLSPETAKMVAQAVQDCEFPVPMRFMYDKEGKLAVGWNREEIEIRKAALKGEYYQKPKKKVVFEFDEPQPVKPQSFFELLESTKAQINSDFQQKMRAEQERIAELHRQAYEEQVRGFFGNVPLLQPKPDKKPEPPPKQEPPPDPKSPKFVLKRPKA